MNKIKDRLTFSGLEILCMLVMSAVVIVGGLTIVILATKNQKVSNFKEEVNSLIDMAKIAYVSYKNKNNEHIVVGSDGETKAMCITIEGLGKNGFTTKAYNDWDGYIVIEEANNETYHYTAWITNKEYVIDGYDSSKINSLKYDKGITKYKDERFAYNVRNYFTGTSGEKGGTGSSDGASLKKYEIECINEKIE